VHAWRTTDFPEGAPDSRVEVLFSSAPGGTRLTLVHAQIPSGQEADYQAGWSAFYFQPMRKYFQGASQPRAAKRRRSAQGKKKKRAPTRRPLAKRATAKRQRKG